MAISIPHKIITSSLPGRLDEVRGESSLLSYSSELSSCVFPSEKDSLQDPFSHDRTTFMSDKVYLESFCWTGTKIGEQIKFQGDLNPQSRSRDGQEKHSPTCRGQGTSQESFFSSRDGIWVVVRLGRKHSYP